ncbi:MAG: hypothetical protein Q9181_003515 [Wetmoreana brouardii]
MGAFPSKHGVIQTCPTKDTVIRGRKNSWDKNLFVKHHHIRSTIDALCNIVGTVGTTFTLKELLQSINLPSIQAALSGSKLSIAHSTAIHTSAPTSRQSSSSFLPRPPANRFIRPCFITESSSALPILPSRRLQPHTTRLPKDQISSPNLPQNNETPTAFSTKANMPTSQPPNWTPAMKAFLKRILSNGEDAKSAIILLETEFPNMVGKVSVAWVERVRRGEV